MDRATHGAGRAGPVPDLQIAGPQELITRRISQVFGGDIDTTITEWSTSHGGLHWGNLTAPQLFLLDWNHWGLAPRGNDAAGLWATALAVPDLADRVYTEFRADLESRSGHIAQLWVLSNILRIADHHPDAYDLAHPAAKAASQLITDLR